MEGSAETAAPAGGAAAAAPMEVEVEAGGDSAGPAPAADPAPASPRTRRRPRKNYAVSSDEDGSSSEASVSDASADEARSAPRGGRRARAAAPSRGGGLHEVSGLSSGFWCTECVITRRGGIIQELNRSSVRELERFCRVEARGNLGYAGSRQSCCNTKVKYAEGCPVCAPGERTPRNASTLTYHMAQYLPVWASAHEPTLLGAAAAKWTAADELRWRCTHPLCTGAEPQRWP